MAPLEIQQVRLHAVSYLPVVERINLLKLAHLVRINQTTQGIVHNIYCINHGKTSWRPCGSVKNHMVALRLPYGGPTALQFV